jgi:SOS-response transcriptional repressor LexA
MGSSASDDENDNKLIRYPGLDLEVVQSDKVQPFDSAAPIYDLKAAAGDFSQYQEVSDFDWVRLPDHIRANESFFVIQVMGESMNRKIPNGSWCLFRSELGGSREGKIVLVEHRDLRDPDTGGTYTVKQYSSEKRVDADGVWSHTRITLKPLTTAYGYKDLVLEPESAGDLRVIGEFLSVL